MSKIKVFISSVQLEFSKERKALADYLRSDPLLGKFFEPFLFEELPAVNLSAQNVYLKEVSFNTMQDTMQDTMQVSPALKNLIRVMVSEHSREELQEKLQMQNRDYFRKAYINEALEAGWIEQTLPDKPTSRNQKYRLTEKGKLLKGKLENKTIGYRRNQ